MKLTFITLALILGNNGCNEKLEDQAKPNVLFIFVDDLGWKDIGAFGSDFYQTPNVDFLATEGLSFDNAYAACTVCSPTRASVMTGKYPATLNCTDWIEGWNFPHAKLKVPEWTKFLDEEEVTMAEIFKESGYVTGHFGKWHLGEDEKYWPENHGFDVNVGGWKKGAPNRNKKEGYNGYFAPFGNPRMDDLPDDDYLTDRLTKEAVAFIEENKDEPFFLNFWLYQVHTPLQAKPEKIEKYKKLLSDDLSQKNPTYAAMVEHMDDAVGVLIQKLKDLGLYDNTIIVFTSDNGGLVGKNNNITNNYPLRSGKGDMYEGGVRVPLIIKDLSGNTAGKWNSTPIISTDFLPTLAKLADAVVPEKVIRRWDGIDFSELVNGNEQELKRESIFWHYPHYHIEGAVPHSAIRNGKWKMIHNIETDTYELYDLEKDISESENLINVFPEVGRDLINKLENWKNEVQAQMPTSNPDFDPSKKR
ncbi:sulfatase [Mongoliibacter sp.]|uniref:sulfatase n=1 Tax=Mongoliibacter sp. TaxID=2022438 RepID=UPI0025F89CE2|nr:sulfatase [Mongoliibacter sp.]